MRASVIDEEPVMNMVVTLTRCMLDKILSLTRANHAHREDLRLAHRQRDADISAPVNRHPNEGMRQISCLKIEWNGTSQILRE